MYTFDAQSLTARENYKLLIGSIIPRPIAFVTTLNQDASVNAAPFSFLILLITIRQWLLLQFNMQEVREKILP